MKSDNLFVDLASIMTTEVGEINHTLSKISLFYQRKNRRTTNCQTHREDRQTSKDHHKRIFSSQDDFPNDWRNRDKFKITLTYASKTPRGNPLASN